MKIEAMKEKERLYSLSLAWDNGNEGKDKWRELVFSCLGTK